MKNLIEKKGKMLFRMCFLHFKDQRDHFVADHLPRVGHVVASS